MSSFFDMMETGTVQSEWADEQVVQRRFSGQGVMLFLYGAVVCFALVLVRILKHRSKF